jgi:hypothetical protein
MARDDIAICKKASENRLLGEGMRRGVWGEAHSPTGNLLSFKEIR